MSAAAVLPASGNRWIRSTHRVVSIVFTLTVVINFVAIGLGHGQQPSAWITYSPLLPLFVLLFSGLWLFVQPYLRSSHVVESVRSRA